MSKSSLPDDWGHECAGMEEMKRQAARIGVKLDIAVSHDELAQPFVCETYEDGEGNGETKVLGVLFCPYCGKDLR